METILVIGASGRVGREVVSQLLDTGVPLRALTRNAHTARWPQGAEVREGDLTRPATLEGHLDGVDSVFLVWTAAASAVPAALRTMAKYARHIVFLSSPYQTAHPFFQAAQPNPMSSLHAEIERHIRASGMSWTFLRPGMFAANARSWWAGQIRAGNLVRWPYAGALAAPIDERDIAAVAVHALRGGQCVGAEYVLTGPQSLSHREQVSTIGEVLGRALRFEELSPEEWRRSLPAAEATYVADMLLKAWAAAISQPALVTSAVAEVTGTPPHTFRDWAERHAADFQPAPDQRRSKV